MSRAVKQTVLVLLLRLGAAATLSAFLAVLMPAEWMAATHRLLGMGQFPASPLVDYLTRSVAALYGFHGGLLLLVSMRPSRYRGIIVYLGWMNIAIGVMLLGIDLYAGMPWFWSLVEGPSVFCAGLAMLYLVRSVDDD